MQLDAEQRRALEEGQPVSVVVDDTECVMVRKDVYERDKDEFRPAETYAAVEAVLDQNEDPGVESYQQRTQTARFAIDRFPQKAERLAKTGFIDSGIDLVHDSVDELFRTGRFALCDSILTETRVVEHSADILLAMLTATLPASSRLASRRWFFAQVEQLLRERGELEDGLLSGLEG